MADWTEDEKQKFEERLAAERECQEREAKHADIGDVVETPDGRQWTVTACPTFGAVDLANDRGEELKRVNRDLVRVIDKA